MKELNSNCRDGLSGASDSKEYVFNAGDPGLIPGSGGHSNPLQYCCLENSMNRGVWQATVYGVARVKHHLATNTFTLSFSLVTMEYIHMLSSNCPSAYSCLTMCSLLHNKIIILFAYSRIFHLLFCSSVSQLLFFPGSSYLKT